MSPNRHGGRRLLRWRAPLIVAFVIPAILCAFTVKSARASFHEVQPILCDGVDDDTGAPILGALPEETTKEFVSTMTRPHLLGKVFCPMISRSRINAVAAQRKTSFAGPPVSSKRLLAQRAGPADDPDAH